MPRLMVDGEGLIEPDRLAAASAANAKNAADTIKALQDLGVGGGPAATNSSLVDIAKAAGAAGDYSNLNKIIKDPEAYDAFKDARLERIRNERIANTPIKVTPSTTTPTPTPKPEVTETKKTTVIAEPPPSYPPVTPTPPTPALVAAPVATAPVVQPVKTAPIDTVLFNEDDVPIQLMQDLIFENIGGQELINIARNDTINGQTVIYQPIKNLTSIQQEYNPNNIVALQATSDKYFQNFSIKFDNKVPTEGGGPNGEHIYIDPATGNLVVEAINLDPDEQIEVEITTSGTIYEAEL